MICSRHTFKVIATAAFGALALILLNGCVSAPERGDSAGGIDAANSDDLIADGARITKPELVLALLYIDGVNRSGEVGDIDRLLDAIAELTSALNSGRVSHAGAAHLRFWRAIGFHQLAFARYDVNDGEINNAELEQALADFEFVMSSSVASDYMDAGFYAGQVAFNFLMSEKRAAEYWRKCAEIGHGGCMNNVAIGYFSGYFGFPVDYQEAIRFNEAVLREGTRFNCAGVYSGMSLSRMAAYLKDYEYENSWEGYLARARSLQEEVAKQRDDPSFCSRPSMEVQAYLLHLKNGDEKPELLRAALATEMEAPASDQDAQSIAILRYFLGEVSRSAYEALPKSEDVAYECSDRLWFVEHALISGDDKYLQSDAEIVFSSDEIDCFPEQAWLRVFGMSPKEDTS